MAAGSTKLIIELEVLLRNLNKTLRGLDQVKQKLSSVASVGASTAQANANNRAAVATQRLALAQQRLQLQQQRLQVQQQRLAVQTQQVTTAQGRAQVAAARLTVAQQRLQAAQQRVAAGAANVARTITASGNQVQLAARHLNSLGAAALRVGGGLRSLGLTASILLTAPLTALATTATKNAIEFDSLRRGLEVMAGTSAETAKQLERLKEIAKAPGIGFQEAIQGSIRLQAVGFSARDAEKALIQFANAVALTGGGRDELERVTVQLGQLAAKGKVVAQDLKPIIEAAPAVGQALLQAFGTVNAQDIQKLGLSSQQFFNKLTDALAKLPRAAAGAKNAFENFQDSVFRASLALGDAILPPLTKLINLLEPIITKLAEGFRQLPESIQVVVIALGALVAAIGPVLFIVGGLVSGLGALTTALVTVLPLLGSIGLPALAAILAGLVIIVGEMTTVIVALGAAWKTNFLGIRELVNNAANAISAAFNRIRAVIDEATRRILPTLESITTKVLAIVTAAWEKYGKVVVQVVGEAFQFIVDVTVRFVRIFSDFVDLILKLIDGDWKGAWQAFSRIVIGAIDELPQLMIRLQAIIGRAIIALTRLINSAIIELVIIAQRMAITFAVSLSTSLIKEADRIRDALEEMFLRAALSVNPTSAVAVIVARFFAAMRKAAAVPAPFSARGETSVPLTEEDVAAEGIFRRAGRRVPKPADEGSDKAARVLRRQVDKFREVQDKLAEQQDKNRINLLRSSLDQQFALTKDGLDRESKQLDNAFEDRLKSVKSFFAERKRIQEAEIDAELAKEKGLSGALAEEFMLRQKQIKAEFETARAEVLADPKLKGQARTLALQTAEINRQRGLAEALNEFETQNAEISTRILTLQRARKNVTDDLTRAEAELTKELFKQREQVRFDLLEEQGRTSEAETGRLKARFTEALKDLRINITGLSSELQDALNKVDLSILQQHLDELPEPVRVMIDLLDIGIKRAQIAEQQKLVEDLSAGLRLDETQIENKVLDGLISERKAQEEIVVIQQKYRAVLLDVLKGELAKAEAIKDQSVINSIKQQIAETERLGVALDTIGQDINRTLFSDLQSGISGIFSGARKGFEGLKDAAISFGERLLDTLNDIAATSIVKQLEGLFKPDATNTQGTIGGFFSKLFGLAPKQTEAAATGAQLTAAAGAAGTALTAAVSSSSTTFVTSVISAATSFASTVIAAGAAFAATVGAGSAAESLGGIGGALGAATGLFPAVPGGVVRVVEGGFPEAVLTTDPRHAMRQVSILKAFLKETHGLGGRIRGLATGGFAMPDLSVNVPSVSVPSASVGELAVAGTPSTMRLRQVLVDERNLGDWVNSSEGEQVMVDFLHRHAPVIRKIGGGRK